MTASQAHAGGIELNEEATVGGSNDTDNGVARNIVGNVAEKFKDSFDTVDVTVWDVVTGSGDAIIAEGDVAASNYNVISKGVAPAINTAVSSSLTSKLAYNIPHDVMSGVTLAVRMQGQEFAMETVGVDTNGNVISETPATPQAISGSITITSNVATVNLSAGHGLLAGDIVVLYGNAYSPLNVGPVVLTSVNLNPNQFTVPCTAANGTYTAGGYVIRKCPCGWAEEHAGIRWVGATAGNADAVSEAGHRPMVVNWNPGNTQDVAVYPNENGINYTSMPYTVSLRPKGEWIIQRATEYSQYSVADQDSTTPVRSSAIPRRQNNASQSNKYKIRFRAENFENLTRPVGAITAISKSASTTATITCPSHGLTANDFVAYFGVRDKTNFADVGTIQVASIVDANTVTVVGGASATATSYGGFLIRVNGNQNLTAQAISVQSYQKTADGARLLLIGSGTWTPGYGTIHTLYGLVNSSNTRIIALEGRYRVAAISTTSIELVPLDGQDLTSVSTSPVNAGGTLIANSDFRLHYAKLLSYARMMVEPRRATGDRNRAFQAEIVGNPAVTQSGSNWSSNFAQLAGQTVLNPAVNGSTNRAMVAGIAGPTSNTDYSAQAWAAASGSGAVIAEANGLGAAAAFDVNLTAWTAGASTGLDIYLQESPDNGTTYYDIWQCEALTAVSRARIPAIPIGGRRRFRWVNRTGAATTATVTITAMEQSVAVEKQVQFFDRTASVTSGTAALGNGAAYPIYACKALTFVMQTGTATAPASFKIQMSMDGTNFYDASVATSCPASSMTVIPLTAGIYGRFARFVCTFAGTSALVTAGHIYGTN